MFFKGGFLSTSQIVLTYLYSQISCSCFSKVTSQNFAKTQQTDTPVSGERFELGSWYLDIWHGDCIQCVNDVINFWQNFVNIWLNYLPFTTLEICIVKQFWFQVIFRDKHMLGAYCFINNRSSMNKFGSTWVPNAAYKVSRSSAFWFKRRRFLKVFNHIWAWHPFWSCDLDKFLFPTPPSPSQ